MWREDIKTHWEQRSGCGRITSGRVSSLHDMMLVSLTSIPQPDANQVKHQEPNTRAFIKDNHLGKGTLFVATSRFAFICVPLIFMTICLSLQSFIMSNDLIIKIITNKMTQRIMSKQLMSRELMSRELIRKELMPRELIRKELMGSTCRKWTQPHFEHLIRSINGLHAIWTH